MQLILLYEALKFVAVHLTHPVQTNIHTSHEVSDRLLKGRPLIKEHLHIRNTFQ